MPDLNDNKHSSSLPGGLDRHHSDQSHNMAARILDKKGERGLMPHPGESLHASTSAISMSGSALNLANITHHPSKPDQEDTFLAPKGELTVPLAIAALVSMIGNSVPHGFNTGVLNAPQAIFMGFINSSFIEHYDYVPPKSLLTILYSIMVSIYLVGGCAGALSAGWIANKFGRKRGILLLTVFGFVAAILFFFSKIAHSFEMIILGRLIVGFGCGAGSGVVPMYLTEIAPLNWRGGMGVLHQFGLTLGIFISVSIGLSGALGNEDYWHLLLAFTAVPCLICLALLPFFPESPRYLLVNQQNRLEAEKALQRFRGLDDVDLDLKEMEYELEQQEKEPEWTFKQLLSSKLLRLPLVLVCGLAMVQQLSGINFVFYYSTSVFKDGGVPENQTQYATLGVAFINVLMTGISIPLIERLGRRVLLLGGMAVMTISMLTLTLALVFQSQAHWLSFISIIVTITFVIGFAVGLGSIPQFIPAELFTQGPRPPAMSIAGLLNWMCNFFVGIAFPSMQQTMGPYAFMVFIVLVILFGVFMFFKLPETKNKTYAELHQHFTKSRGENTVHNPEFEGLMQNSNGHTVTPASA